MKDDLLSPLNIEVQESLMATIKGGDLTVLNPWRMKQQSLHAFWN